jgi:hypothetical protein
MSLNTPFLRPRFLLGIRLEFRARVARCMVVKEPEAFRGRIKLVNSGQGKDVE